MNNLILGADNNMLNNQIKTFNKEDIKKQNDELLNKKLANYFSLEITEKLFNDIIRNEINIDDFLDEFRYVIGMLLSGKQKERVSIINVFEMYAFIVIDDKQKQNNTLSFKNFNYMKSLFVRPCLDDFFEEKYAIKTKLNDLRIILLPLKYLDDIKI